MLFCGSVNSKAEGKKAPQAQKKVYHNRPVEAMKGNKSHPSAQVECKFSLHICAIKTCIYGRGAVYWEPKPEDFQNTETGGDVLKR